MKSPKALTNSLHIILIIIFAQLAFPSPAYAAGIIVNTLLDEDINNSSCSLREAIIAANTNVAYNGCTTGTGTDTISFSVSGMIILGAALPSIASDLTIVGGGLITINGADNYRVFNVNPVVNFNMTGITVSNGFVNGTHGGGLIINNGAIVNISDSIFDDNNTLNGYGGAIYINDATLNVSGTLFSNNGANVNALGSFALGGGAIWNNDGNVTITNSTFTGNFVNGYTADGGAIYNGDFDAGDGVPDSKADILNVTNSTFYNNQLLNDLGGSSAGAIRSASVLILTHNTFSNNDSGSVCYGYSTYCLTST